MAERVSDGLVSAERHREKLLVLGRENEAECDAVEVKMQEALEMQIVAEEKSAGLQESFVVVSLLYFKYVFGSLHFNFDLPDIIVHFNMRDSLLDPSTTR